MRGFSYQGAVLILFVPPEVLDRLAVTPDLLVLLTEKDAMGTGVAATDREDVPTVRIVTDAPLSSVSEAELDRTRTPVPLHRPGPAVLTGPDEQDAGDRPKPGTLKRAALATIATLSVALIAVLVVLLGRGEQPDQSDSGAPVVARPEAPEEATSVVVEDATSDSSIETAAPEQDPAGVPTVAATPTADSLYYSVQAASWGDLGNAMSQANELYQAGFAATVSVVRRETGETWYRVMVGAHAAVGAASGTRQQLRDQGLLGQSTGLLLRTPYALEIEPSTDGSSAGDAVRGLRERGIPAYIVGMPDGTVRILIGAFETLDQAALTESIFSSSGGNLSFVPVSRTGIAR